MSREQYRDQSMLKNIEHKYKISTLNVGVFIVSSI